MKTKLLVHVMTVAFGRCNHRATLLHVVVVQDPQIRKG